MSDPLKIFIRFSNGRVIDLSPNEVKEAFDQLCNLFDGTRAKEDIDWELIKQVTEIQRKGVDDAMSQIYEMTSSSFMASKKLAVDLSEYGETKKHD